MSSGAAAVGGEAQYTGSATRLAVMGVTGVTPVAESGAEYLFRAAGVGKKRELRHSSATGSSVD
jgi:hypothetical protein